MGWWCSPTGCAPRWTRSAGSPSARRSCSGWWTPGSRVTRRTGSCNERRRPRGTTTRRSARRSRQSHRRRTSIWTPCSTRHGSSRTWARCSTDWRSSPWRCPVAELAAQGKVRDLYDVDDDRLLLVATDRISAFDVVLPDAIPNKGRVLTGLSLFWFERTADLVPNHVAGASLAEFPAPFSDDAGLAGRATLVRRARVSPMECVVRGYLGGSGWAHYREGGAFCGIPLPAGRTESARLPERIFTPTSKATTGHDLPLTPEEARSLVGAGLYERLKEVAVGIYERIVATALDAGVIVADTKFEFGFIDGDLALIDEVGTPDSSRFWPADVYEPGRAQPSFDKQFVRDWLDASGWDHEPPPPTLPADVIARTAATYAEAYERLTGEPFVGYLRRAGVENE